MALNNLVSIKNRKSHKRLGRGRGSGRGQTAGRGTKGQKSRSGHNIPRRFEGGQTPLIQRLPKVKGFKSRAAKPQILNIALIEKHFNDGDLVNIKTLFEKGLIDNKNIKIKILGPGKLTKKLKFRDVALTKRLLEDLRRVSQDKTVSTSKSKKIARSEAKTSKSSQ